MNILEAIKKQTLNEKLGDIANEVIKDIENKLENINFERCKCIKVNNEHDEKRKNDYERLLKLKRACGNLEDFESIDIDEFIDLGIDIPIDASIKYGSLKQEEPIINEENNINNDEYEIIKKYLLNNEITYKNMKEIFPKIAIPYIEIEAESHLIFTDGYLCTVSFDDKNGKYSYDSDNFYSIYSTHDDEGLRELEQNEIFIKMREIDILYYAVDFIENQAFESFESEVI